MLEKMILLEAVWLSVLVTALTMALRSLPRVQSRTGRFITPLMMTVALHSLWLLAVLASMFSLLPLIPGVGRGMSEFAESNPHVVVQVAVGGSLSGCALLWRRWVHQGDAWFRIRED